MIILKLYYKYINELINVDELIIELKENKIYTNIINDIIKIIDNTDNTEDNAIKLKKEKLKNMKEKLVNNIPNNNKLKKIINNLNKQINKKYDNEIFREKIIDLFNKNEDFKHILNNITAEDIYFLITDYIYLPKTPHINIEQFEELVQIGIKNKDEERLWRLASNYGHLKIYSENIENYFIKTRNDYYLGELVCVLYDDIDISNRIISKVNKTKDQLFIKNVKNYLIKLKLLSDEQINKFIY